MKRKILILGIVAMLFAMLVVLTGCGNDEQKTSNKIENETNTEISINEENDVLTVGTFTLKYGTYAGTPINGSSNLTENCEISKNEFIIGTESYEYIVSGNSIVAKNADAVKLNVTANDTFTDAQGIYKFVYKDKNSSSSIDNKTTESKLNNSSIEDTVKAFYTALYHQDSKMAYQYIDFVGVVAWAEKETGRNVNEVESFQKKYNEILSDTNRVNEINKYFSNEDIYTKINNDITYRDITFDLKEQESCENNIYSIKVGVRYTLAGTQTGIDKKLYLINKNGKYYFVSEDILWDKQILKEIVPDYGIVKWN